MIRYTMRFPKTSTSDADGMTPAIERFADMDVHSSSDGFDDTSFDDLDMDAFMEVDDDDLDIQTRHQASTREETYKIAPTTSTQERRTRH